MAELDRRVLRGRSRFIKKSLVLMVGLAALGACLFGTGCSEVFSNAPAGSFLGRAGLDDYSPTAIQVGNVQQVWWCGQAQNPDNHDQDTDTILYATYNVVTKEKSEPTVVLAETAGAWDSAYTCNPKVVGGTFTNPLGDGQTYSLALYYTATNATSGLGNAIGVAFSNDGAHWKKYPQPVIPISTIQYYGIGQAAVYNTDAKSGIMMFYEDLAGPTNAHYQATSTDGIHFTTLGALTTRGMENDYVDVTWCDMAYDSATSYWYAAFNMPRRATSTTGGVLELGQMGIALYRISGGSLLSGATPWERVATFDTNLTGHEANFLGGFLRDKYGNLNVGSYPILQLFTSISNPASAWDASPGDAASSGGPDNWDIGIVQWDPSKPMMPLNLYKNDSTEETTTGYVDPKGNFKLQSVQAQLYSGPQNGATVPVYGCKSGTTSYFLSPDSGCSGSLLIGLNGYALPTSSALPGKVPLYSCGATEHKFISNRSDCGDKSAGKSKGALIGFAKR
jgi:hypothetical protein